MFKSVGLMVTAILSIAFIGVVISSPDWGEREGYDDEYEEEREDHEYGLFRGFRRGSREDVRPVENAVYLSECGSCHFAYQPGLLPRKEWEAIMASLEDHYGDDASLAEKETVEILNYLLTNAADITSHSRSRAFASGSSADEGLPRITKTKYFRREHYEIPDRFVRGNPDVGSFSNCQACHPKADTGVFAQHLASIPGVDSWDD
jgi:hypothetical protein